MIDAREDSRRRLLDSYKILTNHYNDAIQRIGSDPQAYLNYLIDNLGYSQEGAEQVFANLIAKRLTETPK